LKTFAVDLESFYSERHSTNVMGSVNYLAHPATDVYLLSVAGEHGYRWQGRPEDFDWSRFKTSRVIAHNYAFDGALFQARGFPTPKTFNCTANLAGYLGSPHALAKAAHKLLGEEVCKEPRAKMKGREWGSIPAEQQAEVASYGLRDAELCLELWQKYARQWPADEQLLSQMTIRMCHDGISVDKCKLAEFIATAREIRTEALAEIPWASDVEDTPLSLLKAREQCAKAGIPAPDSFAEKDEGCARWETNYGERHRFVGALRDFRKSNILLRKLEAMKRRIMPDGRMNYDLRYAGAHTLRWAGAGGLNVQNFAREPWRGIFLRSLLVPAPGKKFVICDLSAIEPRVLAYLAGDEALLDALRNGFGVYEAQALVWGLWQGAKGTLKGDNPALYVFIKSLSLGAGYGMGWVRFQSICAQRGIIFSVAEAKARIAQYRAHNPKVIQLWRRLDYELQLQRRRGMARLSLPSGRSLSYPDLTREKGGLWATIQTAEGYRKTKLWGGVITENAVQAIARDIFADGLLRLEKAGINVVLHAHDEVVCEVDPDFDPRVIVELMTVCPKWIKGLPLAAEAKETSRYVK
jgi:hypothetical protein